MVRRRQRTDEAERTTDIGTIGNNVRTWPRTKKWAEDKPSFTNDLSGTNLLTIVVRNTLNRLDLHLARGLEDNNNVGSAHLEITNLISLLYLISFLHAELNRRDLGHADRANCDEADVWVVQHNDGACLQKLVPRFVRSVQLPLHPQLPLSILVRFGDDLKVAYT